MENVLSKRVIFIQNVNSWITVYAATQYSNKNVTMWEWQFNNVNDWAIISQNCISYYANDDSIIQNCNYANDGSIIYKNVTLLIKM